MREMEKDQQKHAQQMQQNHMILCACSCRNMACNVVYIHHSIQYN